MTTGPGSQHRHTVQGKQSSYESAHTHSETAQQVTQAELDALAATVAALDARVKALEDGEPVPPEPPEPPVGAFYVSPTGNDGAAGTLAAPWRTFRKAALTLTAGQTAIFADGVYPEPLNTTVAGSGTASQPITFRSQNPRGARLMFSTLLSPHIQVQTPYVTIRDFEITATAQTPGSGQEYGIRVWYGGNHALIAGNRIWGTNWCVKANGDDNVVEDNDLTSTADGCVDTVTSHRLIVRRNDMAVNSATAIGVLVKGGSKDAQVYDNYIHTNVAAGGKAIILGGVSGFSGLPPGTDPNGWEAYNCVAFNNVIATDSASQRWNIGTVFMSATDCAFINNVIVGANYPVEVMGNNGVTDGWNWTPPERNPTWINNIIVDGNDDYFVGANGNVTGTLTIDHNLFYNTPGSISGNTYTASGPLFVSKYADWHHAVGSPAIGGGTTATFLDSVGNPVDMTTDYVGTTRAAPWSIGVYE